MKRNQKRNKMLYLYRKENTEYIKSCTKKILRMAYVFVFKWLMFSSTAKQLNYWRSFNLFLFLIFQLFFLYKIDEMLSLAIFQETLNKCEKTKDDFLFIWLWPLTCILFFSPKLMSILNFQMTQCLYSVWLKSCKWFYEVKMRSVLKLLQKDIWSFWYKYI